MLLRVCVFVFWEGFPQKTHTPMSTSYLQTGRVGSLGLSKTHGIPRLDSHAVIQQIILAGPLGFAYHKTAPTDVWRDVEGQTPSLDSVKGCRGAGSSLAFVLIFVEAQLTCPKDLEIQG